MRMTTTAVALLIAFAVSTSFVSADVGIEKSAVGLTGLKAEGTTDESHEIVVTIAKPGKSLEWKYGCAAGVFAVVIEGSDTVPLGDGKQGKGFIITKTQSNGKTVTNVATEGEPVAGDFELRPRAACETKEGIFTFGDVTLADGTKCAVSIRLQKKS